MTPTTNTMTAKTGSSAREKDKDYTAWSGDLNLVH